MLNSMKYISTVPYSGLLNWSVQYLDDSKIAFSKAYPMMRIGEFLKRNKTAVAIDDAFLSEMKCWAKRLVQKVSF